MTTPAASQIFVDTRGAEIVEDERSDPENRDSRDIYLPNHTESVSHIAIDIGGSLAKVVYFTRWRSPSPPDDLSGLEDEDAEDDPAEQLSSTHTSSLRISGANVTDDDAAGAGSSAGPGRLSPSAESGSGTSSPSRASSSRHPASSHPNGVTLPTGALTPTAILSPPSVPPSQRVALAKEAEVPTAHGSANLTAAATAADTSTPASEALKRAAEATSAMADAPTPTTGGPSATPSDAGDASGAPSGRSLARRIRSTLMRRRSLPSALPGGRLNFVKFETSDISSLISFIKTLLESSAAANGCSLEAMRSAVKIMATGGGAHKFDGLLRDELAVEVRREDEMGCLITGLNFITLIPNEVFWFSDELVSQITHPHSHPYSQPSSSSALNPPATANEPLERPSPNPPMYLPMFDAHPKPKLPCLLVNIGSGVSIIKVDDYGKFERISGTSLGGATLWGLLSLLTDAQSFDEMLALSEKGDNSTVDMLVGDIYGSDGYNNIGLKPTTIASSFGKVFKKGPVKGAGAEGVGEAVGQGGAAAVDEEGRQRERKTRFRPEDISKSLLYAVSNNIGQIAYMNAEKHNLDRIYFGGCFIRGHAATISTLSYAIRFWSKGTKRAYFLRHEGYLGAIGAWIKHVDEDGRATSAAAARQRRARSGTGTGTGEGRKSAAQSPSTSPSVSKKALPPERADPAISSALPAAEVVEARIGAERTEPPEREEEAGRR